MKKQNLSFSANSSSSSTKKAFDTMDDIRARLNYNSTRSPIVIRSSYSKISPPNKRLCDYHMSKQDPAVLDQMFNGKLSNFDIYKSNTSPSVPTNFKSVMGVVSPPFGGNSMTGLRTRRSPLSGLWHHSPTPPTFNTSGNGSSLVQMASRRNGVGQTTSLVNGNYISPVLVKMTSMENKSTRFGRLSPNVLTDSSNNETINSSEKPSTASPDPCDKNVVVSALKEKRKRWWSLVTSGPIVNGTAPLIKEHSQPKKPRISAPLNGTFEDPMVVGTASTTVKRPHPPELTSLQPSKKIKHTTLDLRSQKRHPKRLILPDTDIEVSPLPSPILLTDRRKRKDSPAIVNGDSSIEDEGDNVKRRRECTPLVDEDSEKEQEVERKLKLKREATLKLKDSLSKVFPSPSRGGEDGPVRKKVPILCTTGSKPHVFSRSNHSESVTHAALKKDQETVNSRVKSLLMSDDIIVKEDDPIQQTSSSTSTTVTSIPAQSAATLPSLASIPTLTVTNTASLSNTTNQLPTVSSSNIPASLTVSTASNTLLPPSQVPSLGSLSAPSSSNSLSVAPTTVISTMSNPIPASGSLHGQSSSQPSLNLFSLSGQKPSLTGGQQTSLLTGIKQPSLTGGQQPSLTGGQQPSLTGGLQPSLTGGLQPSLTGGLQPSLTGGQQPSLTGGQQPSLTGGQQPSLTGGLQPSLTGGLQPSLNSTQTTPQLPLNNSSLFQLNTSKNQTSMFAVGTGIQATNTGGQSMNMFSSNTSTSLPSFNLTVPVSSTSANNSFNFNIGKSSTFSFTGTTSQAQPPSFNSIFSTTPQSTAATGGLTTGQFNFATSQATQGTSSIFGSGQTQKQQQPSFQLSSSTAPQSSTGFNFGMNQQQQTNAFQFSGGLTNNKPVQNQSTGFTGFGNKQQSTGLTTSQTSSMFNFGQTPASSATPTFNLNTKSTATSSNQGGFSFGGTTTPTFNFGQQPQASGAPLSSLSGMGKNNATATPFAFGNSQNTPNQSPFKTQQPSNNQTTSKSGSIFGNSSTQQNTGFQFQSTSGHQQPASFNFASNKSVGFSAGSTGLSKSRIANRRKKK